MTAPGEQKPPDFFDDPQFDPIGSAIGPEFPGAVRKARNTAANEKRKAGFYMSIDILERFNRKFHEMKLEGIPVENKSALLEAAVTFALHDLDRGRDSMLLRWIVSGGTEGMDG